MSRVPIEDDANGGALRTADSRSKTTLVEEATDDDCTGNRDRIEIR